MVYRLAILGYPLGHTLSPIFHAAALNACGLAGTYDSVEVESEKLQANWDAGLKSTYDGLNVTVPHKVAIMALCDHVSDTAQSAGAVNTLVQQQGRWEGHNTDVPAIQSLLRPYRDTLRGMDAVIFGAGGAARAALSALTQTDVARVHLVNRNDAKARALAREWQDRIASIAVHTTHSREAVEAVGRSTLIMQMTSVGMHPHGQESVLPDRATFRSDQIVFDAVYRPRRTKFLRDAHAAGATIIEGLEMFLHQGIAAFEIWTGHTPPVEILRKTTEQALTE